MHLGHLGVKRAQGRGFLERTREAGMLPVFLRDAFDASVAWVHVALPPRYRLHCTACFLLGCGIAEKQCADIRVSDVKA